MEESFSKGKQICYETPTRITNEREDMISKLHESLISQILLYLPTKEAVKTGALSNRWKNLWRLVPKLDLDINDLPDHSVFVGFVDRFLDLAREQKSCLHTLKLTIRKDVKNDPPCLARWVDFVAKNKLKHLDVDCPLVWSECLEVMPLSLYICETLVYLRLRGVVLGKFESVSLPCLKTMSLELNVYPSEKCLESLISSCPVLEDLNIVRRLGESVNVIRVLSQTITSLNVEFYALWDDELDDVEVLAKDNGVENSQALIDAPKLEYLSLEYDLLETITVKNVGSLTKVNLFGEFGSEDKLGLEKQRMAQAFLTSILGINHMKINGSSFEYLSKIKPLPMFVNLSSLEAELESYDVRFLPTFLKSLPKLKSIILQIVNDHENKRVRLSTVPLSSLEFIKIKSITTDDSKVLQVARYFLKNSAILKKLALHFEGGITKKASVAFRKNLIASPRQSSMCQIEIC